MIHFECEHCRRAVRIADRWAGRQGRCPYCKGLVKIPAGGKAIGELAAALQAQQDAEAPVRPAGAAPPPPAVGPPGAEDDPDMPDSAEEALADTVILPSEAPAPASDNLPLWASRLKAGRAIPALNPRKTLIIVVGVLIVLVAALVAFVAVLMSR